MGLLTLFSIWSRNITRWRLVSVLGFICSIGITGGATLISQGWSSDCRLLLPGKYDMIGFLPKPDEAIYLFLDTQYGPKTCHIPWSAEKSEELQKQQEENGTELNITWWGEEGQEGKPGDGELGPGVETNPRPPAQHEEKPNEETP